jgi:hypothetical protein
MAASSSCTLRLTSSARSMPGTSPVITASASAASCSSVDTRTPGRSRDRSASTLPAKTVWRRASAGSTTTSKLLSLLRLLGGVLDDRELEAPWDTALVRALASGAKHPARTLQHSGIVPNRHSSR